MRFRGAAVYLGILLAVSGCGGGGSPGGTSVTPPPTPPSTPVPTPTPTPVPTPTPTPPPPTSVTVTSLHSFKGGASDGAQPNGPLLQASDGNFYGTTRGGGRSGCNVGCGVVYKLTPSGEVSVLYAFGASPSDGDRPLGRLIQGRDGALYGVTSSGGAYGGGTAFRVTLGGTYSVLHSFGASPSDGVVPVGSLVEASDGSFYGATASGGANHCANIPQTGGNCGTIFKISPAGAVTILHSFGASQSDGVSPNGSLLQGRDGNFYGTTVNGGANSCSLTGATNNCGTVFKITPAGVATVLYSFGASFADGMAPQGGLIQGSDGAFYGTTVSGGGGRCGGSFGCGTVFKITSAGQVTILHAFATTSRLDGDGPSPFLVQAKDGNFYGTTGSGGATQGDLEGTVFKLTPAGVKTTLYSFGPLNTNPSNPVGGLIEAGDGAFYGVTAYSGPAFAGSGTVFRLTVR